MSPKRGPGRPELLKRDALGELFALRFTPRELRTVKQAAERADKTASAWAREALIVQAATEADDLAIRFFQYKQHALELTAGANFKTDNIAATLFRVTHRHADGVLDGIVPFPPPVATTREDPYDFTKNSFVLTEGRQLYGCVREINPTTGTLSLRLTPIPAA